MKKGLLSIALILTMFLTLILFPGNKAEAYYGGYGIYGGLFGGLGMYGGLSPLSTPGGILYTPSRVSVEFEYYESEPSPPIHFQKPEILLSESIYIQNSQWPGPLNTFPAFMPSFRTGSITDSVYPLGLKWLWSDFTAMPSSSPILLWTIDFPPNPYWPDIYSMFSLSLPPAASRYQGEH